MAVLPTELMRGKIRAAEPRGAGAGLERGWPPAVVGAKRLGRIRPSPFFPGMNFRGEAR
jgi:hypothetical protein